ncbi:MAG: ABC transporter ATP-binding protein, partial [Spirochaetaceae bacterium]|nr:ABC transporter ATP-binding protein [Spirochaetaceae bacterium]
YIRHVLGATVLLGAIDATVLITPQLVRQIVDRGIRDGDVRWLSFGTAALLLIIAAKGALTFFQGRLVERASQGVAYDLRRTIHEQLTNLSFSFHDKTESGQLLSRSIQDVERIRFLTGRATLRLVEGSVFLISSAILMFIMNPLLATLVMAALPLLVWRGYAFGRMIRPLGERIQEQLAVLTTRLEQNLRGAKVVKAFAQEQREIDRFEEENRRWFALSATNAKVRAINAPLLSLIVQLATVGIMGFGGYLIVRGDLTYGELVAFTTYMAQLSGPVRAIGWITPVIGMAIASAGRIFEVIDSTSEVEEDETAPELAEVKGRVEFDRVSFAYVGDRYALHDVSFLAEPGEIVALLGETGSGKSTIVNLLPRFYDASSGAILVDGTDIRSVRVSSLRQQIGMVLQETTLFATSIRENIRYGRTTATDAEVQAAAEAAQGHTFILSMPDGYDTKVGELGRTLSGGQKQRIAIARAILMNPRILILDDATSSVDTDTERLIQMALQTLMNDRTSFVIAQRLSTLRLADRILVLENSRIGARGTHAELYEQSRLYREIYDKQLRRESEEGGAVDGEMRR